MAVQVTGSVDELIGTIVDQAMELRSLRMQNAALRQALDQIGLPIAPAGQPDHTDPEASAKPAGPGEPEG